MFETQLDEICLFPLQNKKNSFSFDDKKADEVKKFGGPRNVALRAERVPSEKFRLISAAQSPLNFFLFAPTARSRRVVFQTPMTQGKIRRFRRVMIETSWKKLKRDDFDDEIRFSNLFRL